MRRITIQSGKVAVSVTGVSESELTSFFSPFFTVRKSLTSDVVCCTISVNYVKPNIWGNLERSIKRNKHRLIVLYPSKKAAHHITGLLVEQSDGKNKFILCPTCLIRIDQVQRILELTVPLGVDVQPVLRVLIRDVMKKEWERQGGVLLHASAVELEGQAHLFIGPKGSGKTNLLLNFVRAGAAVLSFDRIMLQKQGEEIIAFAWPTYFNIDMPTFARFSELLPDLHKLQSLDTRGNEGKVSLIAEQVRHLKLSSQAPWNKAIFSCFHREHRDFAECELGEAEIYKSLIEECFSPDAVENEDWHGLVETDRSAILLNVQDLCRKLAVSKSCVRWIFGPGMFAGQKT